MHEATQFISPLQVITKKAQRHSENVAIYFDGKKGHEHISYKELMQQVDNLSSDFQLAPGSIVALLLPRSAEFVVALLAVWKAGLVFMPLEPKWGEEDILARIQRARVDMVITTEIFYQSDFKLTKFSGKVLTLKDTIKDLNDKPLSQSFTPKPEDLAYIYASSGSSGDPKIIEIPHEGITTRIKGIIEKMELFPSDVILSTCSFGFDASLCEILMSLMSGASLLIAPEYVRNDFYNQLPQFLTNYEPKPTVAIFIPGIIKQIDGIDRKADNYPNIKKVLITGEKSERAHLEPLLTQGVRIFNGYGPTETTIGATLTEINKNDEEIGMQDECMGLKIFRITDTEKKILIPRNQEGPGIACIVGKGIGRYQNNEEKNKNVFLDPLQAKEIGFPEERVFITDDLVELKNNQLLYRNKTGRTIKKFGISEQVDLDQVEKKLDQIHMRGLLQNIVLSEDNYIFSYLFIDQTFSPESFFAQLEHISFLRRERPAYYFTITSNQWNNNNGKKIRSFKDIFKISATTPKQLNSKSERKIDEQENEIEAIWRDILLSDMSERIRSTISLNHDIPFEELGGSSLTLGQMISKVWKKLSQNLDHRHWLDFYNHTRRHPTIQGISEYFKIVRNISCELKIKSQYPLHIICLCTSRDEIDKFIIDTKNISDFNVHMILFKDSLLDKIRLKSNDIKYASSIMCEIDSNILEKHILDPYYINILNPQLNDFAIALQKFFLEEKNKKSFIISEQHYENISQLQFSNWLKFINKEINKINKPKSLHNLNITPYTNVININVAGLKSIDDIFKKFSGYFTHAEFTWLKSKKITILVDNIDHMNREQDLKFEKIRKYFLKISRHWLIQKGYSSAIMVPPAFLNREDSPTEKQFKEFYSWFKKIYKLYHPSFNKEFFTEMIMEEFGNFLDCIDQVIKLYSNSSGYIDITSQKSHWEEQFPQPNIHALPYFNWIKLLFPIVDANMSLLLIPKSLFKHGVDEYQRFLKNIKDYALARESSHQHIMLSSATMNFSDPEKDSFQLISQGYYPIPLILFAPLTGSTPEGYYKLASYLHNQTLYALSLSARGSNGPDRKPNLTDKINYYLHIISKIQPKGPYLLLGWSFGAIIAFNVALQLEKKGEKVLSVFNLDCPSPYKINQTDKIQFVRALIIKLAKIYHLKEKNMVAQIIQDMQNETAENLFENTINYLQHDMQNKKFINALNNASVNYPAYFEFGNQSNEAKLKAPYHIYEAQKKHPAINENGYFNKWKEYVSTPDQTEIKSVPGNHFKIFTPTLFQYISDVLWQIQDIDPSLMQMPLSFSEYAKKNIIKSLPYVNPSVTHTLDTNNIRSFKEIRSNFLVSSQTIFLLQGQPGYGKSFVSKDMLTMLLNMILKNEANSLSEVQLKEVTAITGSLPSNYTPFIPLFVNLAEKNPANIRSLCEESQLDYDDILKKNVKLFLILDSLDESKNQINKEIISECLMKSYKLWITCREGHFYAEELKQNYKVHLENYHLVPFNDRQLEVFCDLYNIEYTTFKNKFSYQPLLNVLRIPLFLSICSEYLQQENLFSDLVNRDDFVESLLQLVDSSKLKLYKKNGDLRKSVDYEQACLNYMTGIAYSLWSGKSLSAYLNDDKDTQIMKHLAKIEIKNNKIHFVHNLFYEFYLAKFLFNQLSFSDSNFIYERSLLWGSKNLLDIPQTLEFLAKMMLGHSVSYKCLREKMGFSIKTTGKKILLILNLFALIWFSKNNESSDKKTIARSAANAITLLNLSGINLSRLNFSGVQIPGASLKSAWLQGVDFQDADLTDVNFESAFISDANFTNADLSNINLGSQFNTRIVQPKNFDAFTISKNKLFLATISSNIIQIWDLRTRRCTQSIELEIPSYKHYYMAICFSSDQEYLAAIIAGTIYIYKLSDNKYVYFNEMTFATEHVYRQVSIIFSPQNSYLVVAGILQTKEINEQKILVQAYDFASFNDDEVTSLEIELNLKYGYIKSDKPVRLHFTNNHTLYVAYIKDFHLIDLLNKNSKRYRYHNSSDKVDYCFIDNNLFFADTLDDERYEDCISILTNNSVFNTLEIVDVNEIKEIKFSPSGKFIAATTEQRNLYIWHTFSGKLLQAIPIQEIDIPQIIFSSDDDLILYASLGSSEKINLKKISENTFINSINDLSIGNKAQHFITEKTVNSTRKSFKISQIFNQNDIAVVDSGYSIMMHPDHPLLIYTGKEEVFITHLQNRNPIATYKSFNLIPIITQDGLIFLCHGLKYTARGGWHRYSIYEIEYILMITASDLTTTNNIESQCYLHCPLNLFSKLGRDVWFSICEEGVRYIHSHDLLIQIVILEDQPSARIWLISDKVKLQKIKITDYRNHIFNKDGTILLMLLENKIAIYQLLGEIENKNFSLVNIRNIDANCWNALFYNRSQYLALVDSDTLCLMKFDINSGIMLTSEEIDSVYHATNMKINADDSVIAFPNRTDGYIVMKDANNFKTIDIIPLNHDPGFAYFHLYFTNDNDLIILDLHKRLYYWRFDQTAKKPWSLHYTFGPSQELMAYNSLLSTKMSEENTRLLMERGAILPEKVAATPAQLVLSDLEFITLKQIPKAILVTIFLYIGYRKRAALAQVCKSWHKLLADEPFFRTTTAEMQAITGDVLKFCQQIFNFEKTAVVSFPPIISETEPATARFCVENNNEKHNMTFSIRHLKTTGFFRKVQHTPGVDINNNNTVLQMS